MHSISPAASCYNYVNNPVAFNDWQAHSTAYCGADKKLMKAAMAKTIAKGVNPALGVGATGAGLAASLLGGGGEKDSGWRVPEGYAGVKTFMQGVARNKQKEPAPKIVPHRKLPYLIIPGAQSIKLVSIQDRANHLAATSIEQDGRQYTVDASIGWKVSPDGFNPYRALFNVVKGQLDNTVVDICQGAFRIATSASDLQEYIDTATNKKLTSQVRADYMVNFEETIFNTMKTVSNEKLLHYGVVLGRLTLGLVSPHALEIVRPVPNIAAPTGTYPSALPAIGEVIAEEVGIASVTPITSA